MKKIVSKTILILLLLMISFSSFAPIVNAATPISSAYLHSLGQCDYHLMFWDDNQDAWSFIICNYVVYERDGVQYPAYCLQRDRVGAQEAGGYSVAVNSNLTDVSAIANNAQIYRAITNGFPFKSASELGVANDYNAFMVTKMAVYDIIYGRDSYTFYKPADAEGQAMQNAIINIVNTARNGSNVYKEPKANITKQGDLTKENIGGTDYYVQQMTVTSDLEMTSYNIRLQNMPEGTKVLNTGNGEQYDFSGSATFKVVIPEKKITSNINGYVHIDNIRMKTYPILYGESPNLAWQDYALVTDPYEIGQSSTKLNITVPTTEIKKTERGTDKGLPGAEYDIFEDSNKNRKYDEGETKVKHVGPTNDEGKITITDLPVGSYIAVETKSPEGYNLDDEHQPFEIKVNGSTAIVNSTDTPNVKIVKTERGTNTKLSGAVYEIYIDVNKNKKVDSEDKLVYTTEPTNSEGMTEVTSLKKELYVCKEKISPEGYNLDDVEHSFEINETNKSIIIKSDDTPNVKIEKTERGTNTKLSGAIYEIYEDINKNKKVDSKDKLVYTTEPTNNEGITTVKSLPQGYFVTKEKVAPKGYNLDDVEHSFEINGTSGPITIKSDDTIITSTIVINKEAKDDSEITEKKAGEKLQGAKYNIYDMKHKLLKENLETDENGEIKVVLRYGKYIVEEVRPPEFYLLNQDEEARTQIVEVKKQGELIPITFENEAVKLGLIIEKKGIVQCQANDEIIYNFPQLKNTSNVSLDDFVWKDVLPTDYIRATKLYTGTYNEDLDYEIYYKTNKSGEKYIQYKNEKTEDGKYNTKKNNYIDFAKLNTDEEYVTEWELRFGTVKAGFEAEEKPFMFAKVNDTVKANDIWTNKTYLYGNYTSINGKTIPLASNSDWQTTSYDFSLSIKKLPKTGF